MPPAADKSRPKLVADELAEAAKAGEDLFPLCAGDGPGSSNTCVWFERAGNEALGPKGYGICRRLPVALPKKAGDFCGMHETTEQYRLRRRRELAEEAAIAAVSATQAKKKQ